MSTLTNKTILVTGAGNGIGHAVSKGYAAAGATLVLLDKDVPAMERLYDEILESGGPEPAIMPMDLVGASPDDYLQLADSIGENFGTLEGLLHNASFLPYLSRIDDYEIDIWFKVMQVNLNAGFLLTHACLPLLRAAASASPAPVVSTASVSSAGCAGSRSGRHSPIPSHHGPSCRITRKGERKCSRPSFRCPHRSSDAAGAATVLPGRGN